MSVAPRVAMIDPGAWSAAYDDALCRALGAAGCEVDLFTAPSPGESWPEPLGYRRHASFVAGPVPVGSREPSRRLLRRALRGLTYPRGWRRVLRQVERQRPGILHLQWTPLPLVDRSAVARAVRRTGVRLVLSEHNGSLQGGETSGGRAKRRLFAAADAIVALSTAVADDLGARAVALPTRIRVIPPGVGEAGILTRDEARRRLGLDPAAPVALFAGLIRAYKGLDLLVEAFARLVPELPSALLVVAGLPNMPWEPIAGAIRGAGLAGRVRCELAFLPAERFAQYLVAADVVALPYRRASQSAVLSAALAAGRAVVASRVGGLPEQLGEPGAEALVPPGDVGALAEKLRRWLGDRAAADAFGSRVGAAARERWSWKQAGESTLALYRELLAGRAAP